MARKFVCSYLGRAKAEVSLERVPQEDRATKGKTLFLYPRCTRILTDAELDVISKTDSVIRRKIHIHREIGGMANVVKKTRVTKVEVKNDVVKEEKTEKVVFEKKSKAAKNKSG